MPELPEVETVRRKLLPHLVGHRIDGFEIYDHRLRYPVRSRNLQRWVVGRSVEDIQRRSKYLLIHLEKNGCLVIHFGMSGRIILCAADQPREDHVHVLFRLDDTRELRFRDPRRFGLVDALESSELERDRRFATLGLEPLSDEFTGRELYDRSRGSRKPVKNFLMDSTRVVGVGHIYASEALFLAGVHPKRAAGRLGPGRWESLVASVRQVLTAAIERGGTTLRDFHDSSGAKGEFQDHLRVYDRSGEECVRCGGRIRRVVLAGRSTYYCPGCQR